MTQAITVAYGDGIGPEIMDATLRVLREAGCDLEMETVPMGEALHHAGHAAGIPPEAWASIRRTGTLLKGPMTTPQGKGVKSLNVTLRKSLGLFANVRPVRSYAPVIAGPFPKLDLVVVRENEEDLYAGIEHRQTDEVVQCLKLMSRPGTERLIRYAFEYARAHGRRRVTCMTKDNIMKLTDGLFRSVFEEVATEYPELQTEHMIIDIGTARLATVPERFDVLVLPNLYGDILSDVAAEIAGSVGLAGSCNRGEHGSMYEAIHGSAPDLAGRNLANPSGLLNAAVQMLRDLGLPQGEVIENAWLRTLEDGVHTGDVRVEVPNARCVGTKEFADAVIARLGQTPERFAAAAPQRANAVRIPEVRPRPRQTKELVGVDVFVEWTGDVEVLASGLQQLAESLIPLRLITNRGVRVWPEGMRETFRTDHWRCRFHRDELAKVDHVVVRELLERLAWGGFEHIKTENLYTFDGEPGFSAAQGQ